MHATVGEEVPVTVEDLPGAGFSWSAPSLPEGIRFLGSEYTTPLPRETGSSRARELRFVADRPGTFEVVLDYARAGAEPRERRVLRIEVGTECDDPGT